MQYENPQQLEIRSATGELLLTIAISKNGSQHKPEPKPTVPRRDPDKPPVKQQARPTLQPSNGSARQAETSQAPAEPMTEAQKRFLFRIMAEQGIERDIAYERLKSFFHVHSLKQVTKQEASQGIERLLEEAKGGQS